MSERSNLIFAVFLILCTAVVGLVLFSSRKPIKNPTTSESVWAAVNNWRSSNNLPIYKKDQTLCNYATRRLGDLYSNFSHEKFLRDTPLPGYHQMGENLAQGISDADLVVETWANSPDHLRDLSYLYSNSCVVADSKFVVQIFGNVQNN